MVVLPDGVPVIKDYVDLIESKIFRSMESFSEKFLSANREVLLGYMDRWVEDPLHQWSRQWEYPFVWSKIRQLAKNRTELDVLDVGSGVTFFPFYLSSTHANVRVYCCDHDRALQYAYGQLSMTREGIVAFTAADIRALPYADESFDVVYSISVLEHIKDLEPALMELRRVLVPGGTAVVTFDISLDGTRDVSMDDAMSLLDLAAKHFDGGEGLAKKLGSQNELNEIITTQFVREHDLGLLPWRVSLWDRLKCIVRARRIQMHLPLLTVFCFSVSRRPV